MPWPLAQLGYLYARLGRKSEAEQALQELARRSERRYVSPYFLPRLGNLWVTGGLSAEVD
jgi:hypothetical protein